MGKKRNEKEKGRIRGKTKEESKKYGGRLDKRGEIKGRGDIKVKKEGRKRTGGENTS